MKTHQHPGSGGVVLGLNLNLLPTAHDNTLIGTLVGNAAQSNGKVDSAGLEKFQLDKKLNNDFTSSNYSPTKAKEFVRNTSYAMNDEQMSSSIIDDQDINK